MSLIKFNGPRFPWNERLQDFFNQDTFINHDFFNLEKTMPSMNVKEHDDDFEIELAAPGFDKKDFIIEMKDDVLEVSAERKEEESEKKEDYTRREFSYNSFKRTMQLPTSVDQEKDAKATYKDGILRLKLLKREEAKEKPKKMIEVV
jgi:HSP20 family protein